MKVNINQLIMALESMADWNPDDFFLDKTTGEILSAKVLSNYNPERLAEIDIDQHNFISIRPLDPHESWQIMEDFLVTLEAGDEKESLEKAMLEGQPFISFKNALGNVPHIRRQWFEFHRKRMDTIAKKWLAEHSIFIG